MDRNDAAPAILIRAARLVPVGTAAPTTEPVDLRIRAGRIVDLAQTLTSTPDDEILDADGRWASPGLWDHHVHMSWWAQTRTRLDVSSALSPQDTATLVAHHLAAQTNPPPIVVGFGFRPARWDRQPRTADLDAVSPAVPVVLSSGDGHTGWLNSAACALLDVPPRDGPLTETPWFAVQDDLARAVAQTEDIDALVAATVDDAAARGIVGIVDFEFSNTLDGWRARFATRGVGLRVRTAIYPDRLPECRAAGFRTGSHPPEGAGMLEVGPLKIFGDGSLNARTACCFDDYADAAALESPRGQCIYDVDELSSLVAHGHASGLNIALHAIGDRAVDMACTAFEATGARGRIEHAQLVRFAEIARMWAAGITASKQPAHLLDDRAVTDQCWPDRADRSFALRSMLDGGVTLALGSDAPVAALDPRLSMAAAIHRGPVDEPAWHPEQALTPQQAWAASTDGQRTLRIGSRADIVLLDADPFAPIHGSADTTATETTTTETTTTDTAAAARRIRQIGVEATLVNGEITYAGW